VRPPDITTEELIREIKQGLNMEGNFRRFFESRAFYISVYGITTMGEPNLSFHNKPKNIFTR